MNKIKRFFTDKRFIYGSGSVALFVGFIAVIVLVNIIIGTLSDKFTLKLDLTENKIFKLSEQTIEIVKAVNEPVDIILFETSGYEDAATKELLERYVNLNNNFKLKIYDPVKDPMSAQKYSSIKSNISAGTIVFDNGRKFKVISPSDLRSYNSYTKQNDQFQAENKLTTAIMSLSKSRDMTVAFTQGHGESAVAAAEQLLKDDSITVEKVSTVSEGFSEKYDLFMIASPKMDFTAEEINALDLYLKNGKSVQVYLDVETPQLPKLESYLSDMGIAAERNIVFEGDNKKILNNVPYCFIPAVKEHSITGPIVSNDLYVVTYANRVINKLWDEKNSVKIETLLESSGKSFAMSQDGAGSAVQGPFSLAVIATKTYDNNKQGKVLVMGSSIFLEEQMLTTNKDFFLGSVNWQIDNTEPLNIRPKSLSSSKLEMTQQDFIIWFIVLVIFIPIIVLVFGLATWLRRRHL